MRRIVAMGLVELLLTGCAINSATSRPDQDLTQHEECDRTARSSVRGYWRQFWCGPGCGVSRGKTVEGISDLVVTPGGIIVGVAFLVVATPIFAAIRAVKTPQERQKEYDRLYQYCQNLTPGDAPPQEPPPADSVSPGFTRR